MRRARVASRYQLASRDVREDRKRGPPKERSETFPPSLGVPRPKLGRSGRLIRCEAPHRRGFLAIIQRIRKIAD